MESRTPLHWAAFNGNVESCRLLLAKGADPNRKDFFGNTAVDTAASACDLIDSTQHRKLLEMLRAGSAGQTIGHTFQLVLQFPCTYRHDFDHLLAMEEPLRESLQNTPHILDGHDCKGT